MALKPCLTCQRLTRRGSRCRKCERSYRGSSGRQATFRRKTLATTGGACARCGSRAGVEAHHLHPVGEGGDPQGPGLPLCSECHKEHHEKEPGAALQSGVTATKRNGDCY